MMLREAVVLACTGFSKQAETCRYCWHYFCVPPSPPVDLCECRALVANAIVVAGAVCMW